MKTLSLDRRSLLSGAAATATLALLPRAALAKRLLRMSTLGPGTSPNLVMTTFANIVNAELPDYEIQVNATGAATRHVLEVAMGKTDFCMSSPAVQALMAGGKAMFQKIPQAPELATRLRTVFNFPMGVYHIAVYELSGITALDQIAGKRVFLGPPGGAAYTTMSRLIEAVTGMKADADYTAVKLTDETMIVFTSDHGDYLGDHWMGEKELFHDPSARIPLIVVDPAAAADATRGTVSHAPVEAIDVAPTVIDFFGGDPAPHIIEGRSLRPILHGQAQALHEFVVSEYDYAMRDARRRLGVAVRDARLTMLFDGRWKYVHAETFRPMLFDLETDPDELIDLGADPAHADQIARMEGLHFRWARRLSQRTTRSDDWIAARDPVLGEARAGILIDYRNEEELRAVLSPETTPAASGESAS